MRLIEWLEGKLGVELCDTAVVLFALGACAVFMAELCRFAKARIRRKSVGARRVEYTLPDKDNGYVRARLSTVLRCDPAADEEREEHSVCLSYARELLAKLKAAPLTQAERLETEGLEGVFSLYFHKPKWSANDLRAVNGACSRLIKLSAKYAV